MFRNSPIHLVVAFGFYLAVQAAGEAQENRPLSVGVTSKNTGKQIVFYSGDAPVLAYNHQLVQPPKGIGSVYARSGHIHPIYTPNGKIVTDDFSDDHAHQHGLFNAFVKAKVEGETIDFWNQHKRTGNVSCVGFTLEPQKPGQATTKQKHYRTKDGRTIFEETWLIQASVREDCFVTDLAIEISNVTDKKIVIQKNHYGSFGLRGSGQWRKADASEFEFLTSTEKNRKNGNLSRENWVAMQGKIDGDFCGIVVLSHPKNFRHPQPSRLHPTMPYFSFAPMNLGSFEFDAKQLMKTRFRIVTYDGKLDREKISRLGFE